VYPAVSHEQADLAMTPQVLRLDWFYLHVYPLIQMWSPGWVWVLLVGVSSIIVVAPWAPSQKKEQPALVTLDYCNGCERCVDDCPFGAVEMVPRTDETNYSHEASVDPGLCVGCGICVGACPTATPFRSRGALVPGIDLPDNSAASIREDIVAAGANKMSPHVIVFACRDDGQLKDMEDAGISCVKVKCMGQLPPSYVDFSLSRGHADGVLLLGCQDGNCSYRFGAEWTEQRIARQRDPMLRRRVDLERVALGWQAPWSDYSNSVKKYDAFKRTLEQ
jgi:ferredoxin/coenzyme F420-reducing hydrogenase delta subunit